MSTRSVRPLGRDYRANRETEEERERERERANREREREEEKRGGTVPVRSLNIASTAPLSAPPDASAAVMSSSAAYLASSLAPWHLSTAVSRASQMALKEWVVRGVRGVRAVFR
jgi:hypothetical protein